MSANTDAGRQVLIEPLLDRLQPSARLVWCVDDEPDELTAALERARPLDLLLLRGAPTWHSLRALAPVIAADAAGRAEGPPVVVVEAGAPPGAALPERSERAKDGVRLGLVALGEQLDPDGVVAWWAPDPGVGVFVPSARLPAVADWLAARGSMIDVVNALHERNVELDARSLTLFELLDQSQHNALELVRSSRFRVGTRIVRLGRRLLRKERVFRAPLDILARMTTLRRWRAQLAAEHASRGDSVGRDALSVTYIVPELRLSGGVIVVLELVKELRRAGVDARVVALKDRRREMFRWRLTVRPKVYRGADEMVQELAATDVVVATHWQTAASARAAVDAGRAGRAAYFLQDYEPWFHAEGDHRGQDRVRETYALIPDRIVTSEWLRALLADEGYDAQKIALGVDLGFFYPRPAATAAHPVVLAMARPRTPRRGFETLVGALTRVHEARPDAEIVLFGEDLGGLDLPFPYRAEGVIGDPQHLAEQYSSARVFVDVSDFQAYGLPVLEAMACGTVSVVTRVGGVNEYAWHDENCLLVSPKDADTTAGAVLALLADDELHRRLRDGALATSRNHSMRQVAMQTREAFEKIRASSPAP